jgi:predicted nucleotidyltransferase
MLADISYPPFPRCVDDFEHYYYLKKNWDNSYNTLSEINKVLNLQFNGDASFSIVVAGSYGRMEASPESDLDYIIITEGENLGNINKIRQKIIEIIKDFKIPLPNDTGVFAQTRPKKQIIDIIGDMEDDLVSLAQRLLLIMETKAIYNEDLFKKTIDEILRKYLEYVIDDPKKEAIFLLNDLIRYFRSIAVNYQYNFWKDNAKWTIRNVKLRHSRILIYAGLLLLILNSSKNRTNKYEYIFKNIFLTPLEKIISVYRDNHDYNYYKLLGAYNIFLGRINNKEIRASLQVDYEERYNNPYYSELKVTSDAFQGELTRFIDSHRGNWTETIFEYLIF